MNGTVPAAIAVVFDFDDTLVPDSTTALLKAHAIDADQFWKTDVKALITQGFDPTLAYLKLLLENVGDGKPLGKLSNTALQAFGRGLERQFYPGLRGLLRDLKKYTQKIEGITVELYIVSGGLAQVILGSEFVRKNFTAVYGCELAEDESGIVRHIKRAVTFTEKTRYLFEINKGLAHKETQKNPYLVNSDIDPNKRRIPFKNIIYVGDGLTDIPCFSLVKHFGGTAFGVFNPGDESSAKRALVEFLKPDRVISVHAPKFGKKDELGSLLRAAVANRVAAIQLERGTVQGRT